MTSIDFSPSSGPSSVYLRGAKISFLVWAPHSMRAEGISKKLNAKVHLLNFRFRKKIYAPIKYPLLFSESLAILKKEKPDVVFAQLPPIFCGMAAVIYKLVYNKKAKVVLDLHTAALVSPWSHFRFLTKLLVKKTALVIVTNEEARNNILRTFRIDAFILEDKIPEIMDSPLRTDGATLYLNLNEMGFSVVVPSSFANDEPIEQILQAASALPDIKFYITGDERLRTNTDPKTISKNVIFTGFLEQKKYYGLLMNSSAIMALTTRDETLLASGYEALACEKPLITSSWPPIKRYFSKGAVFVNNTSEEIVSAIQEVRKRHLDLQTEIRLLKQEKQARWESAFGHLLEVIQVKDQVS